MNEDILPNASDLPTTYCRELNDELNDIHRAQFLEMSGALLRKNRSEMSAGYRSKSDDYVFDNWREMLGEEDNDTRRINFVNKANELFRESSRSITSESSFMFMSHAQKLNMSKVPRQNLEVINEPQNYNIGYGSNKRTAELLAAIKLYEKRLEDTNEQILRSQSNKQLLKFRLDQLILKLTQMGYDPNAKPNALKIKLPESEQQDCSLKMPDNENTSWWKLKELINQYESRLQLVKSLEEREEYFKQHMMTPATLLFPNIMDTPSHPNASFLQ